MYKAVLILLFLFILVGNVQAAPTDKDYAVVLPMTKVGNNVYTVPITIGSGITEEYLFDTGASGVSINKETLAKYIASGGMAIKGELIRVQLADGSIILVDTWVLESLTIGKCTFRPAYVSMTNGINLFGAVLMGVMSPVVVDYDKKVIVLFCPDKIVTTSVK